MEGIIEKIEQIEILFNDEKNKVKILSFIDNLHPSEQALIVDELLYRKNLDIISYILYNLEPEVLTFLSQTSLTRLISQSEISAIIKLIILLDHDDAVEVLEGLTEQKRFEILKKIPLKKRIQLKKLLSYPENSVGRIMDITFISVPYWWTANMVLSYVKEKGNSSTNHETPEIYVTDEDHHIKGRISLSRVISIDENQRIDDHIEQCPYIANTIQTQQELAEIFKRYDLKVIPVTNRMGKISGIVEVGAISDVITEQSEQAILKAAGVLGEEKKSGIFKITMARFLWLFINLGTAIFASIFISFFEESFAILAALAVLMPIVASMGGNSGTQTVTVIVRMLATGEMRRGSYRQYVTKELLISILNGILFAIVCFVMILLWYKKVDLALVFGASIFLAFLGAGLGGTFVPIIIHKMKLDPAISSTVFLTAITDIVGFVSFLGLANIFLM